jgi:hypothetical protein
MDTNLADDVMIPALERVTGIVKAYPFSDLYRRKILKIEKEAEEKGLMGLGKVVNSGVREVLQRDLIYIALTDMDFDWGCDSSLVLKKGDEIVGKEVRDEKVIADLSNQKNVWFMHQNFVVYKDKISFPKDIMKQICHFDIPALPAAWCVIEDKKFKYHSIICANPSTPSDTYLKTHYFKGVDEKGLGTVLVGVEL